MEKTTTKAPAKGNKTTEIILGAAAAKLATAVKSITSAVQVVTEMEEKVNTSTLEVVNLEDKIGSLKQDFTNKVAQNKIEIEQAFKADQQNFVDNWCRQNNVTLIKVEELNELKGNLEEATDKKDEAIAKAVAAATGSMKKDHDNALALKTMEFEKKEASNSAEITQMKLQNKFLEDQVGHWKTMLESQQKNETERAKYGQISTLNVGTQPGR